MKNARPNTVCCFGAILMLITKGIRPLHLSFLMFVLHFSFSKITSAEFVDGQQREAQLNEGKMKRTSTLFHIAQCDARNQSHWCCHNFFLCFNAIFCKALLIKKGKIFLGKSNYNNKTEKVVMFWWTYRWNKKKKIHAHPHHYMGQVLKKCINTKNELTAGILQNASFIYLLHINSV